MTIGSFIQEAITRTMITLDMDYTLVNEAVDAGTDGSPLDPAQTQAWEVFNRHLDEVIDNANGLY